MEILKLIIDLIKGVIWPITIIAIIIMFRKEIRKRLQDIKEVSGAGMKVLFNDKHIKVLTEEISDEFKTIEGIKTIGPDEKEKLKQQFITAQLKRIPDTNIEELNVSSITSSDVGESTLLAFTANQSYNENLKYNIYYDPATRNHNSPFHYIGLYAEGTIFAVGTLNKIIHCNLENGELVSTFSKGFDEVMGLTHDEISRIKGIIKATDYYDLEEGNKFFLVDKFHETNFIKSSAYPLRAKKYIWLDEIEGFKEGMTGEQLAGFLDGKEWE